MADSTLIISDLLIDCWVLSEFLGYRLGNISKLKKFGGGGVGGECELKLEGTLVLSLDVAGYFFSVGFAFYIVERIMKFKIKLIVFLLVGRDLVERILNVVSMLKKLYEVINFSSLYR